MAVTVKDLNKSVEWFSEKLGFTTAIPPIGPFEGPELSEQIGVSGAKAKLAFMNLGNYLLELSSFENPKTAEQVPSALYQPNAVIPGFSVENLDEVREKLEALGVEFLSENNPVAPESPLYALGARRWVRIYTNERLQIELIETI